MTTQRPPAPAQKGRWAAQAALVTGLLYAAVSVYWGAGGTRLLDTVGGSLARRGHARDATVIIAVWAAAAAKLTAAILPPLALRNHGRHRHRARLLAWAVAGILTTYGAVLTTSGILVQTGVIHSSANADRRALMWHAYLWDPWFLAWGILIASALLRSRVVTPARS